MTFAVIIPTILRLNSNGHHFYTIQSAELLGPYSTCAGIGAGIGAGTGSRSVIPK
ncbi:hypothetical protein DSBG_3202 [Desulfosporosinus sp. BG]|nr:hypothetical protein DSBG_3202 [Desulfosporosinus sp. BG]